jgi:methylphosphotriester-DNA--protein-cysteine methyltransferase
MDSLLPGDIAALDRARVSRDPRFDGKFFIAVTSTGIYCRPICPVRSPKPAHIRYFPTAAAAAEAGFRPCLRCRPEAAPGTPAWLGTSAVVRRALRLIDEGVL